MSTLCLMVVVAGSLLLSTNSFILCRQLAAFLRLPSMVVANNVRDEEAVTVFDMNSLAEEKYDIERIDKYIEQNKTDISSLEALRANAELMLMAKKAKTRPVLETLSLVENMLKLFAPDMMAIKSSKLFIKTHILEEIGNNSGEFKLKESSKQVLKELEGSAVQENPVIEFLLDFYHEVSKPTNLPKNASAKNGILVGGEFPLRAAVGLFVVEMQKELFRQRRNIPEK